ncbi:MAG: sigma-54-dependent transcriptional regulator [Thermoguttaceae bacterium]
MNTADRQTGMGEAAGRVLVVDDHRQARESMADVLRQAGHDVSGCSCAAEALKLAEKDAFDCVVTDLQMPGMSGIELIVQLERRRYGAQIVMVTAHASVSTAVEAMRHGAFDYIEKPFDVDQLESLVAKAVRNRRLLLEASRSERSSPADVAPVMLGISPAMQNLRDKIARLAPTPETVLIHGESGTGKELVAKTIHALSSRASGPMVSLNCPVLSDHLMESELFGHERGAFTGAEASRTGRFELAHGGSILLDEVTEIDLNLQAKLLRVLQERSFERVGSSKTIEVDVRVLATTNRDLKREVAEGRFREDLYYRLAVVPVEVPPLRDRREDVPMLIQHFLLRCADRLGREPARLDADAMDLLARYDWPGNVRELENVVTRASVLHGEAPLTAEELRRWLMADPSSGAPDEDTEVPVGLSLEEMEKKLIEATLNHYDGHRVKTAKALGIGVRTLTTKLRQYGYAPREKTGHRAA